MFLDDHSLPNLSMAEYILSLTTERCLRPVSSTKRPRIVTGKVYETMAQFIARKRLGSPPQGHFPVTTCGNPDCLNPAHLKYAPLSVKIGDAVKSSRG